MIIILHTKIPILTSDINICIKAYLFTSQCLGFHVTTSIVQCARLAGVIYSGVICDFYGVLTYVCHIVSVMPDKSYLDGRFPP